MTESQKSSIVLFPPIISISPLSDKYKTILNLRWGDYETEILVELDTPGMWSRMATKLNESLLEGSETNPFTK